VKRSNVAGHSRYANDCLGLGDLLREPDVVDSLRAKMIPAVWLRSLRVIHPREL
jgi:hypothetical protein